MIGVLYLNVVDDGLPVLLSLRRLLDGAKDERDVKFRQRPYRVVTVAHAISSASEEQLV